MWNPAWQSAMAEVLYCVDLSIQAEQVFCSIVTEMKFMSAFQDNPSLAEVHKQNYETSYHRNTAAGNLRRWLTASGPSDEQLILMTVECFIEAREHDKQAERALLNIQTKDTTSGAWLKAAEKWHRRRRAALKDAAKLLKATIPPQMWEKGAAMVE